MLIVIFLETVEESSTSRSKYELKIKQLQDVNKHLDLELQNLRSSQVDMGLLSDGVSNVLNPITAATKSLARRVVSLAPTSSSSIIPQTSPAQRSSSPTKSIDHTNLEECMRKVSFCLGCIFSFQKLIFQAQDDAAMLRSLVIPLEQEIDALKVKLRQTDQDLQWFLANTKVTNLSIFSGFILTNSSFLQLKPPTLDGQNVISDKSPTGSVNMLGAAAEQDLSLRDDSELFGM